MMVARWHIDAKFGHKQDVIDAVTRWHREIGPQLGLGAERFRVSTGSIGSHESVVEVETTVNDLKELDDVWARMAQVEAHRKWSHDLEPHVVSGTNNWEVLRVVEAPGH